MFQSLFLVATVCTAGPQVEVGSTSGLVTGELVAIDRAAITLSGDKKINLGDLVSLRRAASHSPDFPTGPHVELVSGDRMAGRVVSSDGNSVRLRTTTGAELRLPSSAIRVIWVGRPSESTPEWLEKLKGRDAIVSLDGEVASGVLTSIDSTENRLVAQINGKELTLDWRRIQAIAFNPDLARPRRPKGPYYRLTLADGSRWSVGSLTFSGSEWVITSLYQETIRLAASVVQAIDVEQGKSIWLADLKPTSFQYMPSDGESFSMATNRNVLGNPIRVGPHTFDRGLGLHAECIVTYTLSAKYRRLEMLAGLDTRDGARGQALLRVVCDDSTRELPQDGRLAVDAPVRLSLDISGVKQLKIEVRRGKGGIVQDCVNLAEARLLP